MLDTEAKNECECACSVWLHQNLQWLTTLRVEGSAIFPNIVTFVSCNGCAWLFLQIRNGGDDLHFMSLWSGSATSISLMFIFSRHERRDPIIGATIHHLRVVYPWSSVSVLLLDRIFLHNHSTCQTSTCLLPIQSLFEMLVSVLLLDRVICTIVAPAGPHLPLDLFLRSLWGEPNFFCACTWLCI